MKMKQLQADLWTIVSLVRPHQASSTHSDRLEKFYAPQSRSYDSFRKRLLNGREDLLSNLNLPPGGRLLDLGGGTGSNIEVLGDRRSTLSSIEVVDLCPSLLKIARERITLHGWKNAKALLGDATTYSSEHLFDVVLFSYSLTMIPDWFSAIENAYTLLKPGGELAVVDFYVSRKWPDDGCKKHSLFTRTFLPFWFSHSNVFLSSEHLPYLRAKFPLHSCEESSGRIPYCLGLHAPYYLFWGKK
jgi:S-adenosylmethionine-diacylgycerolhomoserine-N-methlytransferase